MKHTGFSKQSSVSAASGCSDQELQSQSLTTGSLCTYGTVQSRKICLNKKKDIVCCKKNCTTKPLHTLEKKNYHNFLLFYDTFMSYPKYSQYVRASTPECTYCPFHYPQVQTKVFSVNNRLLRLFSLFALTSYPIISPRVWAMDPSLTYLEESNYGSYEEG